MTGNRLLLLRSDLCMLSHLTSTRLLLMVSMIYLPTYLPIQPSSHPPAHPPLCLPVRIFHLISLSVLSHQDSATLLVLLILTEKISEDIWISVCRSLYMSPLASTGLLLMLPAREDGSKPRAEKSGWPSVTTHTVTEINGQCSCAIGFWYYREDVK